MVTCYIKSHTYKPYNSYKTQVISENNEKNKNKTTRPIIQNLQIIFIPCLRVIPV